jgi:hypothetical protein
MVETPAELPFIGDQVVCLSHDQAARSGPRRSRWTMIEDYYIFPMGSGF